MTIMGESTTPAIGLIADASTEIRTQEPVSASQAGPGEQSVRQGASSRLERDTDAFWLWRPRYHLMSPHGWMNDPCGLGYDPATKKYHQAFQWNSNGPDWGDIAWGYSYSYNLISWHVFQEPCLVPSTPYDKCGVFTGCLEPTNLDGVPDGKLTYIYTSVSHLPIDFRHEYTRGCETLSVAVSADEGLTWERHPENPILTGPPELDVTGWRDPFISSVRVAPRSQRSDSRKFRNGFISGGIRDRTPTVFVYEVDAQDLTDWKYVGILLDVGLNFRPSRWSGDAGVNWEVANYFRLCDGEGATRDFIVFGTQGCLPDKSHGRGAPIARDFRNNQLQLWMSVKDRIQEDLSPAQLGSALKDCAFGGYFDHGLFYAANSFYDPTSQHHVVFGWITEEDLPDHLRHRQNWSGLISLPRVVKLITLRNVTRARSTDDLSTITSIEVTKSDDSSGTFTLRTLGVEPDSSVEILRAHAAKRELQAMVALHGMKGAREHTLPLQTDQWELSAEFSVGRECGRVGLAIGHDPEYHCKTILFWEPSTETFVIERPPSLASQSRKDGPPEKTNGSTNDKINHAPEIAPHTLFTFAIRENGKTKEVEETLRIRAFFDVSVLEVFVNDRTAISTRIYCESEGRLDRSSPAGRCFGMRFFAEESVEDKDSVSESVEENAAEPCAVLRRATVWDGLRARTDQL